MPETISETELPQRGSKGARTLPGTLSSFFAPFELFRGHFLRWRVGVGIVFSIGASRRNSYEFRYSAFFPASFASQRSGSSLKAAAQPEQQTGYDFPL